MDTDAQKPLNQEEENISGGEKNTMHNAGVDLSDTSDDFIDIDSSKPAKDDVDLQKVGLTFIDDKPKVNKEDLSSLAEQKKIELESSTRDLEREFQKTVGSTTITPTEKKESLNEQVFGLTVMLEKIKEKLGFKKTEVKEELMNLKKVKEDISKDIENIKELEESEEKIELQLKKVESIQKEISSIEDEVEEELKL